MGLIDETKPWKVLPEEKAWLKKLDANNPDDIERYKHIDADSETLKWMEGEIMTDEEVLETFSEKDELLYGVCGEKSNGKIEGWVSLYELDTDMIDKLAKQGLIDFSKDTRILEISYARYIDPSLPAENREKGLIASAIRQICSFIFEKQGKIVIVAFTNPKNPPSEKVLKDAGFVIKGRVFYDEKSLEKDNFWIKEKI